MTALLAAVILLSVQRAVVGALAPREAPSHASRVVDHGKEEPRPKPFHPPEGGQPHHGPPPKPMAKPWERDHVHGLPPHSGSHPHRAHALLRIVSDVFILVNAALAAYALARCKMQRRNDCCHRSIFSLFILVSLLSIGMSYILRTEPRPPAPLVAMGLFCLGLTTVGASIFYFSVASPPMTPPPLPTTALTALPPPSGPMLPPPSPPLSPPHAPALPEMAISSRPCRGKLRPG